MATAIETSIPTYPDSPLESEEAAYPCKGCGEVCLPDLSGAFVLNEDRFWRRAKRLNLVSMISMNAVSID